MMGAVAILVLVKARKPWLYKPSQQELYTIHL
jgi:hypothetical protein